VFDERVPPEHFATFDEWRRATQMYQAELVRHHVEVLRRLKYRPTGGFCVFALNDPGPVVSWSLLDHRRVPKLAWEAFRRACGAVIVVADRPPSIVTVGESLALDVHVVNDLRSKLDAAEIEIVARWAGGERRWRFGGSVDADDCTRVGTVSLDVPHSLGGLTFDLTLTAGDLVVTNHYATAITVAPE
jgi:beta-mannosidase